MGRSPDLPPLVRVGRASRPHLLEAWGQRFDLQLEPHQQVVDVIVEGDGFTDGRTVSL